jgi:hypothetical protein
MSEIRNLTRNGETFYPQTHVEAVSDPRGEYIGYYVDDPEWIRVVADHDGKILAGIKVDGSVEWSLGIPQPIKDYIQENIITVLLNKVDKEEGKSLINSEVASSFDYKKNPEYLSVELDSEEKVLGGRKADGTKFENVGLDLGSGLIKGMDDPEGRMEIKTDSEQKIISYRKEDGTLVENVGVETNHLELTKKGMTDFQKALKDSGFTISVPGDWSDKESVELPEPKHYSMLNLMVDSLPIGSNVSEGFVEYYDFYGNYFKKSCSLEPQGQSSSRFANTGGKGNYTLDVTDDSEIKFGSWVPQDSFHLKGNYRDATRGILPTAYKWAYIFMNYLDAKPNRVMLKDDDIAVNHASGDRFTDWYDDARCLPDGFPVEVYLNGEYYGLYSFQLKKHRKNYSMDKKDYTSLFLDADAMMSDNYQHGLWNEGPDDWWTLIDIKGPKDLICMDGSKFDGDHPKELIDETSEVYDASNKAHKGSRQSKNIIRGFSTKYLEVKALIDNSDIVGAKAKFNENFDYNACMLVYIFNCLMNNGDSVKKNTLWATYKNGKVAPMLWDLDGLYSLGTFGDSIGNPSAGQWRGSYATAAWPLALFWALYEPEIKATYAELRQNGIINMNTWKSVIYDQWTNRIGVSAYERDIKKWSETPSYRENYTNTDYWQERGIQYVSGEPTLWNANTSYNTGDTVTLRTYPTERAVYMVYKAIQPSTGVCPVTKFYEKFPVVGGCYDSPKRMEKWMTRQIELCDQVLGYTE